MVIYKYDAKKFKRLQKPNFYIPSMNNLSFENKVDKVSNTTFSFEELSVLVTLLLHGPTLWPYS